MKGQSAVEIVNEELAAGNPPSVPPEKMADLIDLSQSENLVGFFKRYSFFAQNPEFTQERRNQNQRKAEYWRQVADLVWQRKEKSVAP